MCIAKGTEDSAARSVICSAGACCVGRVSLRKDPARKSSARERLAVQFMSTPTAPGLGYEDEGIESLRERAG